MKRATTRPEPSLVVGYVRVSTDEQGDTGYGLEAQENAIRAECRRRKWTLLRIERDVASGASRKKRPGLALCIKAAATGECGTIMVAKLDRLSRSLTDFADLMATAKTDGWSLVALDLGVDTSTPTGKLIASIMAVLAEWERELIGQRTKDALVAVKARGVKLGRPTHVDAATVAAIRKLRAAGHSYRAIADVLTRAGVFTPQQKLGPTGVPEPPIKAWQPTTVRVLITADDDDHLTDSS